MSSILFFGKNKDEHCHMALEFLKLNFEQVDICCGSRKGGSIDSFPEDVGRWKGDYIISYLSPWIIPKYVIERANIAAINFHPAPPEYPGTGCINFALYEQAVEYGSTCHHMATQVDTGDIIAVKRFPIFPNDDLASLLRRTYDFQLVLFYEIISLIAKGNALPSAGVNWTRKPFTRTQLDMLSIIEPHMAKDEIDRRVRATCFEAWKPIVHIGDYIFELRR